MTDQPDQPNPGNQPNPGQQRQINLQQMANQFMSGLQRHFDMLAFNLAARERVNEQAYNERSAQPALMPVAQVHQNFEQMQAHARDLMLRQVLNDSLNLSVNAMNNAHLFLSLIKVRREEGEITAENQKTAQEAQQAFLKVPFDQKFDRLEKEFGIVCEFEDTITNFGICLQALAQHQGYPKKEQLDESGQLVLDLVIAKDELMPNQTLQRNNYEVRPKAFGDGEKVHFSDSDLQAVLLTIGIFAHQLFASTAQYAQQGSGGGGNA
mgnify:FL=1